MDEILLLEAVERYINGEMLPEEQAFFEDVRKNNAEVDQLVVEHTYFLQSLNKFGTTKAFKQVLQQVDTTLLAEGVIAAPVLSGRAKVFSLWHRYKRNIAVAASIAGFISVLTSGLVISYGKKYGSATYTELDRRIKETDQKLNALRNNNSNVQKVVPKAVIGGTGFLIDGKGYLITNGHVINKMKNIFVENNRGEYFTAEPIYIDATTDLAVLKITDTAFKVISSLPYTIKKGNADLAEQFFTLGFPRTDEIVYGEGYVSAKSGNDGDSLAYQLTVSANPGNSGGPVINHNGEIIGIITAKDNKADGVVYAAKSKNIFNLIEQIKKDTEKPNNIKLTTNSDLKKLDKVQQVKKMEEFVFMVVGN